MNYVVYDMHAGMPHMRPRHVVCWQGKHADLRKRFPEFFAKYPNAELYLGHAIVAYSRKDGTDAGVTLYGFDCQEFVYEDGWNERYPEKYHGKDDVVVLKNWSFMDRENVPKKFASDDPAVNPVYQYVDKLIDNAVPFWEAIKTLPLVPVTIRMTEPEERAVRHLAVAYDVTPETVIRCLLQTEDVDASMVACGYIRKTLHPGQVNPPKKEKVKR